jgi:hypothetical protein
MIFPPVGGVQATPSRPSSPPPGTGITGLLVGAITNRTRNSAYAITSATQ